MPENLIEDCVGDLTASLGFLTRLPMAPAAPASGADIGRAAWAFPIAGIVVGMIGTIVYVFATSWDLWRGRPRRSALSQRSQ